MKKSNLMMGISYLFVGVVFLLLALFTETKLDGLLFGFTGSFTVLGGMMLYQYIYWNSPKNRERYRQKLENEKIEKHDELKEKVRGKSAQYAYIIGLFVISISSVLFSVLDSLKIVENGNVFVFFLAGYLMFQLVLGTVIFNHLMKKY